MYPQIRNGFVEKAQTEKKERKTQGSRNKEGGKSESRLKSEGKKFANEY